MSFGIPYLGSKNIYAKQICEALPEGKRLVDLFAGGCAITDCAIKKYANKWETFLINDIAHEPLDLYVKCLCGNNPVSYEWVSREEFKSADWATRLVWSFGNDTSTYLYGKEIEPLKHDIETWIVDGVVSNYSGILTNLELPNLSYRKDRRAWWLAHKDSLSDFLKINVHTLRLSQRLQSLKRLDCLYRPEKLEHLEFSYLSYEQYEYRDGDVVYCDIPYKGTYCKQYNETGFDHDTFWEWAKSRPFDVFVSERTVPDDAKVIFTKQVANRATPKGFYGLKTEYLVRV